MQVSTHLLILRTGEVLQFVNFNDRAWHAGRSSYLSKIECNDYSIGIELEGSDDLPFEEVQYQVLTDVVTVIRQAYPEIKNHIAGHSDVALAEKPIRALILNGGTLDNYLLRKKVEFIHHFTTKRFLVSLQ